MKHVKVVVLALVLALTASGCAGFMQNLFATGVSVEAVGDQFVVTSEQVTLGCNSGVIPANTCEKYRVFGTHFKKVYPVTVGLWQAARKAGDKAAQQKAEDVVRSLALDLTRLAAEALQAFIPVEVK